MELRDQWQVLPAGGDTATPLNLKKRLLFLRNHGAVQGKRLLDCGCGEGDYVVALRAEGVEAVGVEYQKEKVDAARQRGVPPDWVSQGDLERLEYSDASFDLAYLNEVLEHVPDEMRALTEIGRVLKRGGLLLVLSPNRWYPFESHGVSLRGSRRPVPHFVPFVPYVPLALGRRIFSYWARNYWPHELSRLVRSAGFTIVETGFLWQTFENISGHQPRLISALRPILRAIASTAEGLPGIRRFGVSQAIVAVKPA